MSENRNDRLKRSGEKEKKDKIVKSVFEMVKLKGSGRYETPGGKENNLTEEPQAKTEQDGASSYCSCNTVCACDSVSSSGCGCNDVCTCDGHSLCNCNTYVPSPPTCSCNSNNCSCNKVCTCNKICICNRI